MTVIGRAEVTVVPGSMSVGEAAILEVLKDIREELKKPTGTVINLTNLPSNTVELSEEEVAKAASRALYYRIARET